MICIRRVQIHQYSCLGAKNIKRCLKQHCMNICHCLTWASTCTHIRFYNTVVFAKAIFAHTEGKRFRTNNVFAILQCFCSRHKCSIFTCCRKKMCEKGPTETWAISRPGVLNFFDTKSPLFSRPFWMDGWIIGWMDRQTDVQIDSSSSLCLCVQQYVAVVEWSVLAGASVVPRGFGMGWPGGPWWAGLCEGTGFVGGIANRHPVYGY